MENVIEQIHELPKEQRQHTDIGQENVQVNEEANVMEVAAAIVHETPQQIANP